MNYFMKQTDIPTKYIKRFESLSLQQLTEELDKMKADLEGYATTYKTMIRVENMCEAGLFRRIFFCLARKYHFGVLELQYKLYQHAYYLMLQKAKEEMLEKHPGISTLIEQGRVQDFDEFINNYLQAIHQKTNKYIYLKIKT